MEEDRMYPLVSNEEHKVSQIAVLFVLIVVVLGAVFMAGRVSHEKGVGTACPRTAEEASKVIGVPADKLVRRDIYSVPAWYIQPIGRDEAPYLVEMQFGFTEDLGGASGWNTNWIHPSPGNTTWFCVYPNNSDGYAPVGSHAQMLWDGVLFKAHQSVYGGKIYLNNGVIVEDCYIADAPTGGYALPGRHIGQNLIPAVVNPTGSLVRPACPDVGSPLAAPVNN